GITVIDLGVFDGDGDGLVDSHDVTLFKINSGAGAANANVSPIAGGSVNVAAGTAASLQDSFRFQALTNPIYLAPGDYSVIAYSMADFSTDPFGIGGQLPTGGNVTNIDFLPFGASAPSPAYPTFGVPNLNISSASFRYNLGDTTGNTTVVPTPAMLPGLIGMGIAAWRKRKGGANETEA
ncbi:MAG TPA: PTPA-CTERM sorting domain-containing protein, partial [Coleofasciculaceae cyanobacterium]